MKRIAIPGPGLIGGSIALRLRRLGGSHVTLWARRTEAVSEVIASACADEATADLSAAVKDADPKLNYYLPGASAPVEAAAAGPGLAR